MSLSPIVPLLLSACWILPTLVIVLFYVVQAEEPEESATHTMNTSLKGIRADVGELDFEPQTDDWRDENWEGPGAKVRAEVTDSSREIMILTPYAEASVSVRTEKGTEKRRCSICQN
jgi:hypothetical protein